MHQVQKNLDAVLNRWFLVAPEKIGVAVSGGVDSLALAFGLYAWAQKKGGCVVVPMIVNHGLHQGEAAESAYVASLLQEWGMEPVVLRWQHPLITTGVLEKARHGKYATLAMACHHRGIRHVCFGHHQDDMLETVWMRKQNDAPAYALSGISAVTMRYGVHILRPLLHTAKNDLTEWMTQCGVVWVQDPCNTDARYVRTVARENIQKWTPGQRNAAWTTLCDVGNARCAHESMLRGLTPSIHGLGYVRVLDFSALMSLPISDGCLWIQAWVQSFCFRPIAGLLGQRRLWLALIEAFSEKTGQGGKTLDTAPADTQTLDGKDVAGKSTAEKGPSGKIIATFAGCIFVRCNQELWIFREHARIAPEPVLADAHMWDDRVFAHQAIELQRAEYTEHGAWQDRFVRVSLPKNWNPKIMTYVPCNFPYPHFSTLEGCGQLSTAHTPLGQNHNFGF